MPAEGNPDEEKIGAFGVGKSREAIHLNSIHDLIHFIRVLQLILSH